MKYNFDEVIDRKNTGSMKWDFYGRLFDEEDIIPMWVADMDFRSPKPVIEALEKVARFGVFGYTEETESYHEAVIEWLKRRHNWTIRKEWLHYSPGVVPALHWIVKRFAHPGDKVILQPPVYYPFFEAVETGGCHVVNNPLQLVDGYYQVDFEDLKKKAANERVKMIVLCSPHNPVGRVWSRDELERLGRICMDHNVLVVSDEIHADLLLNGNTHTPFASISEEFARNSITCYAPTKTFNLAGLQISNIIIPNPTLASEFKVALENNDMSRPNIFAVYAAEAAYRYGDQWLDQVLAYFEDNHALLKEYIGKNIPEIKVTPAQATYLAWLDCRGLGLDSGELAEFMEKKAGLGLSQGYIFGEGGEGFVRMNLGCPRSVVEEALKKIDQAVEYFCRR